MTGKNKAAIRKADLPSYKNPPINEVVCGLQFQEPDKLRIPHIGLLWDRFRSGYPTLQHASPIITKKGEILVDNTTGAPLPRVWFINKEDDQLIQFQIDRFYFNWRRRKNDYPRYNHVIRNFEKVMRTVSDFFKEFDLGELKPIEYELTYINRIPKGQGWDSIDDLPHIFTDFAWDKSRDRFLQDPGKVTWMAEFELPEQKGFLNVNLKQATNIEDKLPLLILELKTRGNGELTETEDIRQWFDMAHEWIVRGFTDLTTPEVQQIWEKE